MPDLPSDKATFLLETLWLSGEKLLFAHTLPQIHTLRKSKLRTVQALGFQDSELSCCRLVPTAPRVLTPPRHPEIAQGATTAEVGGCCGALTRSRVVCVMKGRLFRRRGLHH